MNRHPLLRFSLREATELLPALQRMTARASGVVDRLLHEAADEIAIGEVDSEPLAPAIDAAWQQWAEAVRMLGARPAGLWRVEFDNGEGFYCWRWSDPRLVQYRPYGDEATAAFHPIQ